MMRNDCRPWRTCLFFYCNWCVVCTCGAVFVDAYVCVMRAYVLLLCFCVNHLLVVEGGKLVVVVCVSVCVCVMATDNNIGIEGTHAFAFALVNKRAVKVDLRGE